MAEMGKKNKFEAPKFPEDKNEGNLPKDLFSRYLPREGAPILFIAMLISGLLHLVSFIKLDNLPQMTQSQFLSSKKKSSTIKFRVLPPKIKTAKKPKKVDKHPKKILEAAQKPTEAPKEADHFGQKNHVAKKETRVIQKPESNRALDPLKAKGGKAKPRSKVAKKTTQTNQTSRKAIKRPVTTKSLRKTPKLAITGGRQLIKTKKKDRVNKNPRNAYEKFLNTSYSSLQNEVRRGYQDHLDKTIEAGNKIDINTKEYRYIGYFTNLRKAVELVWNYPREAVRRGLQGIVGLEFTINADGSASRVKVVQPSGHSILDTAIVDAINLASPFPPLPKGFSKDKLTVTGSFSYVLNNF